MNWKAIVLGRCPRCHQGRMFKPGLLGQMGAMNDVCDVCGLPFLRESGYYLGAMYISYALGVFTVLPVSIVLAIVVEWPLWVVLTIMVVQTLVMVPLFLRFSRIIWLHLDVSVDPRQGI